MSGSVEVEKLQELAEKGDALAQTLLGAVCAKGVGGRQDFQQALKWYRMAAGQGDAVAQLNIGQMYYNGEGVRQNHQEAAKCYQLAARHGDALSQFMLASFYAKGLGVEHDSVQAHAWFNLAAAQGFRMGEILASRCRDELAQSMKFDKIQQAQELAKDLQKEIDASRSASSA